MHTLPAEINYLIIDHLVQSSYKDDEASNKALRNCRLVCIQFYTYTRVVLPWKLIVNCKDLSNPDSTLLSRFSKHLTGQPLFPDLLPLLSVARSVEIDFRLDRNDPDYDRGATLLNVGNFLNSQTLTAILESFTLPDSQLEVFSLKCHVGGDEMVNWTNHITATEGAFSRLFETLCNSKITDLRLNGISGVPSNMLDGALSVKHLTLHNVGLQSATAHAKEPSRPAQFDQSTPKFDPVSLDAEALFGDLDMFLDPSSASMIPYRSRLRHSSLIFGLPQRFRSLRECRIHWTVSEALEFLGCLYETAPNLEVVRIQRPYFYPSYRLTDKPHPPWSRKPPESLQRFELFANVVVELRPSSSECDLRYLNFHSILASTSQLPQLSHVHIQTRFVVGKAPDPEEKYWFFMSKAVWEDLVQALMHCTMLALTFEILIGDEFEQRPEEGAAPTTSKSATEEQTNVKDSLNDSFQSLLAVNPKANLIVRFLT